MSNSVLQNHFQTSAAAVRSTTLDVDFSLEWARILSRRERFYHGLDQQVARWGFQTVIKKMSNATQKEEDLVAVVAKHASKF